MLKPSFSLRLHKKGIKMSKILSNISLGDSFYLMKVDHKNNALPGQFYMLKAWDEYPILQRPISVYDADAETVSFLYKVVGKGTKTFAELKKDDDITLLGALGNGFPIIDGKIALVGGGVGIAPLYLTAKAIKAAYPKSQVDIFLGFSGEAILEDEFKAVCDNLHINIGGFITDLIDTTDYETIMSCGPDPMMKALYKKAKEQNTKADIYVSLENHMACGVGACLVCTCKTPSGNKKACKDGPVLKAEEVYGV